MEHAQRLQMAVFDARQGRNTSVPIGAVNAALFDIMPQLTRIAKQRHPHLSLSISEMDSALAAVQNGEIDIALARFDQPIRSLEIRPIVRDHLVIALPIDHPLTKRDRIELAELAGENLVLSPRRVSPSFFDQIVSACRQAGFSPRLAFEVRSVVSQIAFVGCGGAIGMVPSRSMRFGGGDVVFRPLIESIDVVTIAAAWDPTRRKDVVPSIVEIATDIGTERRHQTPHRSAHRVKRGEPL
jgi:DNA-binding transcriptional LysR family regulator